MPAVNNTPLDLEGEDLRGPEGWFAEIGAVVGNIHRAVTGPAMPRVPWEACHPVPILGQVAIVSSAGTLQQKDLYGPKTGYWWDLRRLSVYGFTAGTVTVFKNSAQSNPVHVFTAAGDQPWSAAVLMAPEDQLLFVAAGITGGPITIEGQAIEVETSWLPVYLM